MQTGTLKIGEVVSWTARECSLSGLRAACVAVGHADKCPPEFQTWQVSAARGIAETCGQRGDFVAARLAAQSGELARWHIAARRRESDRAEYENAGLVIVRESGPVWVGSVPLAVRQAIEAKRFNADAGDVSAVIVNIIGGGAAGLVPLRERGGAYFVPEGFQDQINAAEDILRRCGGRMLRFSVGQQDRESAAQAIAEHVKRLSAELAEEAASMKRQGAITERALRVSELRAYVQAHASVLLDLSRECEHALSDADRKIAEALASNVAAARVNGAA